MVKQIYTRVVVDIASGRVIEKESFEYRGKIAECKGGAQTSVSNTQLPAWLQPYAEKFMKSYEGQAFDENGNVMAQPADLTQQTAGFQPGQEAAIQNIQNMTGGMQDYANLGVGQSANTIGGMYLNPDTNPYIGATYDRAARKLTDAYSTATAPSIMAAAQRGGNFGGSAMDQAMQMSQYDLGENLANLGTSIYGGNYANERSNQLNTMAQLPQTLQAAYAPQQNMMGVGSLEQGQQQSEYDTNYSNALNRTQYPFEILSGFGGALGQAGMGAGTSTTKAGGGGGGGLMGSLLCSEARRQGRMSDEMWEADSVFGANLPRDAREGYLMMAAPVVRLMRKSPLVSALLIPLILLWGKEMYRQVTGEGPGSRFGRFVLWFGLPFCGWLGKRREAWATQT